MSKQHDILKALNELKDNSIYEVPKDYFDTLPDRIHERIRQDPSSTKNGVLHILKPWLAIAAGLLFLVAVYISFDPGKDRFTQIAVNTTVSAENDDSYFDPIALQISEYDLASYISEKGIDGEVIEPVSQSDLTGLTIDDIENLILF